MTPPTVEDRLIEVLALGGIPTIYKCRDGNYAVRLANTTFYDETLLLALTAAVSYLRPSI